jgi:hypothetical protein
VLIGDALNNRVRLAALDLRLPLAVAFTRTSLQGKRRKPTRIAFTLSRDARVTLTARRGASIVARIGAAELGGKRTLSLRGLPAGSYTLRLEARSADGRLATARASLHLG